jgi:hypothetical protein
MNSASMLYSAKHNDYERVKILFRYGYRLERIDRITDPLKRIEIFKAITSPAYIVATLENVNDVSSDFFCPVKKCFEFACEASAKGKAMPEYKREYSEIEHRSVLKLVRVTRDLQVAAISMEIPNKFFYSLKLMDFFVVFLN